MDSRHLNQLFHPQYYSPGNNSFCISEENAAPPQTHPDVAHCHGVSQVSVCRAHSGCAECGSMAVGVSEEPPCPPSFQGSVGRQYHSVLGQNLLNTE